MQRNDHFWKHLFFGALLLALLGVLGTLDRGDELEDDMRYCHMVKLHEQDARYGWPDYKGEFDGAKRPITCPVAPQPRY